MEKNLDVFKEFLNRNRVTDWYQKNLLQDLSLRKCVGGLNPKACKLFLRSSGEGSFHRPIYAFKSSLFMIETTTLETIADEP